MLLADTIILQGTRFASGVIFIGGQILARRSMYVSGVALVGQIYLTA